MLFKMTEQLCRKLLTQDTSVLSQKFLVKIAKGQTQILRLTTPKTEKRLGPLSLRMTGCFMLWT